MCLRKFLHPRNGVHLLSKCAARCCLDGESGLNGGATRRFQAFEKAVSTNQTGDYPFHRPPPAPARRLSSVAVVLPAPRGGK